MSEEIVIEVRIVKTSDNIDISLLKEMLMNAGTSFPNEGCPIYHGSDIIAEVKSAALV